MEGHERPNDLFLVFKMAAQPDLVQPFGVESIPLLAEEGWLRHQSEVAKPPKSRRRGGQSGEMFRPEDLAELTTPSAPSSERIHFVNAASTPPLQGGECACPESVTNITWDTTLLPRQEFVHDGEKLLCAFLVRIVP